MHVREGPREVISWILFVVETIRWSGDVHDRNP